MAYEIVLPPDTQNEIEEFIEDRYIGQAAQMAAVDAVDHEIEKLAINPTLGAVPRGTPFQTRRVHRFRCTVGDVTRMAEIMYRINKKNETIVLSGFREVRLQF